LKSRGPANIFLSAALRLMPQPLFVFNEPTERRFGHV